MKKLTRTLLLLICALALAACGGGGGSAGTSVFAGGGAASGAGTGGTGTTTSTAVPTVALTISSSTVTAAAPATLTATVKDATGAAAAGQVVSFNSPGSLGVFAPVTALTDANGVATSSLSPVAGAANGADLAVAKVTLGTISASGSIGFQILSGGATANGSPTIAVALSTTTVSAAAAAIFTATVKDGSGAALAGQVVKFSSVGGLGAFTPASALTDATGKASVSLTPSGAAAIAGGADLAVAQTTTLTGGQLLTGTVGFVTVPSSTSAAAASPSMTLSLSTTTVTTSTPATVTAFVRDGLGHGVTGQVVKFSTIDGKGSFSVSSALTDSTGAASVTLTATAAGSSGADNVVATTTLNGTALQASQGFQLTASNVTFASFVSDIPSGTPLSAYGQSNLTATIAGAVSGTTVNVSVTSTCVAQGKATLTPATASTTTGVATFTYRDNGCGATAASDSLQAAITGTSATAPLGFQIASPAVGSITFASATPQTIYLKGSGLGETSTVLFRVLDSAGNGLPNQSVDLEASTLAGGLTLDGGSAKLTKRSDSLGNVSLIVNSGTVPTPVRVKATLTGAAITTVSSSLAIAVGKPSQLNFSFSQQTINIEGASLDGTTNVYNIIASDRLGNPVPAGTAINFVTEGGQIEAAKFTTLTNGLARASANFISSEPRPADMRVTVLAYALGEESFIDTNGNNVWDAGEPFQDLGNVYLSRLYNNHYDGSVDQFIALSIPGVGASQACVMPTSPLLALDKSIPSVAASTCDGTWGPAYVRRAVETVFSTSSARPVWTGNPGNIYALNGSCASHKTGSLVTAYDSSTGQPTSQTFLQMDGGTGVFLGNLAATTGTISFLAADANGVRLNPMPAGTTIAATAPSGITLSTVGGTPVANTSEATQAGVTFTLTASTATPPTPVGGTITILLTSPGGVGTSIAVPVSNGSAPAGAVACQ